MYICDLNFISDVSYGENQKNRLDPSEYYVRLGRAMVGIALPGVGYDTFRYVGYEPLVIPNMMYVCMYVCMCRLWETLTIGSIAVIEKGIGLDKTVWN